MDATNRIGTQGNGAFTFDGEEIIASGGADGSGLEDIFVGHYDDGGPAVCPHLDHFLTVFGGMLVEFSRMPKTRLLAVFGGIAKKPLLEIAADAGVSPQAASYAKYAALKRMPALRAVLAAQARVADLPPEQRRNPNKRHKPGRKNYCGDFPAARAVGRSEAQHAGQPGRKT